MPQATNVWADKIRGTNGDDILDGTSESDILRGLSGHDRIFGNDGDDKIFGGKGDDTLIGGPGADVFNCGPGSDSITDFNPEEGDTKRKNCESLGLPLDRSYDVNVLVISYFPLTDEGTIDVNVTGDEILRGITYEQIKQKTTGITNNLVQFLGEATSNLGYADPTARAALNYHIFDTIEHLEAFPVAPRPEQPLYPDYQGVLTDHNICDYVDNHDVKEVWIWAYEGSPQKLAISESKMSGPFGDISNSGRLGDMPLCGSTYVVYTFNYARGTSEAMESWGHQIEAELDAVDVDNIFRDKFQGPVYPQTFDVAGRCGSVHNPPNARFEYDRDNPSPQLSDCLDWDPDGLGELSEISCENWGCDYNSDTDNPPLNYMIWNWQNVPGINNAKEYQGKQLRNWWDVHGDFDDVISNNRRLTVEIDTPTAEFPTLTPSEVELTKVAVSNSDYGIKVEFVHSDTAT